MNSIATRQELKDKIITLNSYAKGYNDFMPKNQILTIKNINSEIQKRFTIDYSKPIPMTKKEEENLRNMITDYIRGKKDTFNTHYIQLLAWHIHELDLIPVKKHGTLWNVTFLEYSPNPLIPISATNRIFSLFLPRRIEPEKVSTALVLNYLNNYEYASQRFMNVLNSYLKRVHYSRNTDIYFNFQNVINYINKRLPETKLNYFERLKILGIREITINTKYFNDILKRS